MLKDMAYTKAEIKKMAEPTAINDKPSEEPRYPYGLELRIEKDSLKKLGFTAKDFKIGDTLGLEAMVKVTSVSMNDSKYGSSECVCVTVTSMDLEKPDGTGSAVDAFYKNDEKE